MMQTDNLYMDMDMDISMCLVPSPLVHMFMIQPIILQM